MTRISFGRYSFEASREEKVFFPDAGLTKSDLMDYYERVASVMLPHLKGRPLTLQRFPDGISGEGFFQQQVSDYFPDWISRGSVEKEDGQVTHVIAENKATLVYLASQACITLHAWLSRMDQLRCPDRLVFDLDPPKKQFEVVATTAVYLRDRLDGLGLRSFVMSTGSRGLHVVVPLDRSATFDEVRGFARTFAESAAAARPQELTVEQRKAKRRGRLYLDVMRNAYGQTSVAPYSVRARRGAPVAVPLEWKEVEDGSVRADTYRVETVVERLGTIGDPWKGIGRIGQSLTKAVNALQAESS